MSRAQIAAFEQAIEKAKAVDGLHWTPKAADVLDTLERAAKAFVIGIRVPGRNDRASLGREWRRRWERAQAICPVPELLADGKVPKAGEAAWTACRDRVLHGEPQ